MVNRRSGSWIVRILSVAAIVAGLSTPTFVNAAASSAPDDTTPAPTTTEVVIDEANPFLPESADLTDCVGTVQRPGCGSEARGGWHQNLVAIAMVGGLLIIFGRVAWGVRRSQKHALDRPPD